MNKSRSWVADTEVVIVGAGAVGLATAYALVCTNQDVIILERHAQLGSEISSRSSEVAHAGLYYPPDRMKARLCRTGADLLKTFCNRSGVPFVRCGKLIVATGSDDGHQLARLKANAEACGVSDLQSLTQDDIKALEPELASNSALLSPSTAVFDSAAYLLALEGSIVSQGGQIVRRCEVTAIARGAAGNFVIDTGSGVGRAQITCKSLVLCGGLAATSLGQMLTYPGRYQPPETFFAKGHYFALTKSAPFHHLIYPLPSDGGLGIHYTRDWHGGGKFGPDIAWSETPDVTFDHADARARQFRSTIKTYWPRINDYDLVPAYVGVRPKLSRKGEPTLDFAIHTETEHGIANLIGCYGIESPGLTASLAIGEWIAQVLRRQPRL